MKSICGCGLICNWSCCLFSVSLIRSACYPSDMLILGPQHPECGATSSQAFVNAKLFKAKTIKRENRFLDLAFVEQCGQKSCIFVWAGFMWRLLSGITVAAGKQMWPSASDACVSFPCTYPKTLELDNCWAAGSVSPPPPGLEIRTDLVLCLISVEAGAAE